MTQLQIAVVGAGLIGRRHVEVLRQSAQCTLSAIVDPSQGAEAFAGEMGVAHYLSMEDLFDKQKPDGVILATPNQLHVSQALECISAGVPALIEKPVANSLQEGMELQHAAQRQSARLLVGHHRPYSSLMSRAVEVVESGTLGDIVAIVGMAPFYKAETEGYFDGPSEWRRQPGGGRPHRRNHPALNPCWTHRTCGHRRPLAKRPCIHHRQAGRIPS